MICIRSFLQEIRFLSLSYWWWCLFMFPLESPFPFFILHVHLCYELNDFLFCFSLVVFDGLIITSLRVFVNTFLCFYAIIFIYLFYYVFIFYNLFVFLLFSVNLCYCEVVKNGMVCCKRTVGKDGRGGWGFGGLVLLRLRGFC